MKADDNDIMQEEKNTNFSPNIKDAKVSRNEMSP